MSKRDEAYQAIKEWREAMTDATGIRAPLARYDAGWVIFCGGWDRSRRISELREWTERLRARTAARASETAKEQPQP